MNKRHTFGALATGICLTATLGLAGCGGGGSHTASVAQFCKDNISLGNKLNVSDTDLSDLSGMQQVHKVLPALSKLTDEAPSAIKSDLEVVSKQLRYVTDGKVDQLDSGAFDTAYGHIDDFLQSKCHVSGQADSPFSTGSGSSASSTTSGDSSASSGTNGDGSDSASQYGSSSDTGNSSVNGSAVYGSGSDGSNVYGSGSDGSSPEYGTDGSGTSGSDYGTTAPSTDPSDGSSTYCTDVQC